MYAIRHTAAALKALRRMPRNIAELIRLKLREVAVDPAAARNVKKLKGRDGCRLRVGDRRVIFTIENGELVLIVIEIGPQGDVYD